ncbi:hypothetical protein [Candidatus Regiella endosymbiont of Tuberolachnus salignus]|uniref:hypothetical protein n=1 Tax=Candidatus Regiella endosymbiont of Tuberolachnus salignus TaxID=3077956 RepID=UPI0030CA8EC4
MKEMPQNKLRESNVISVEKSKRKMIPLKKDMNSLLFICKDRGLFLFYLPANNIKRNLLNNDSDATFFAMPLHPVQNDLEHHPFLLLMQIINHQHGLKSVKIVDLHYFAALIECFGKIAMGAWGKK